LFFIGEQNSQPLRVFNRSTGSSIKLKNLPKEDCFITGTAYLVADSSAAWQQFKGVKLPFSIHHEDKRNPKHAHSIQVCLDFHSQKCDRSIQKECHPVLMDKYIFLRGNYLFILIWTQASHIPTK